WARKRRPSSIARSQRSTGTKSGQRDSRMSRVRPKRLKRPKSGGGCAHTTATELSSLMSLLSQVPCSTEWSRMARDLPMGAALHREPDLDLTAARRFRFRPGAPLGRQQGERRANAIPRAMPSEKVADSRAGHSVAGGLV